MPDVCPDCGTLSDAKPSHRLTPPRCPQITTRPPRLHFSDGGSATPGTPCATCDDEGVVAVNVALDPFPAAWDIEPCPDCRQRGEEQQ